MENRLKRMLADGVLTVYLGMNQARTPNIALIADIERMRRIPVPRI
jgi:hypothetical protein